MAGGGKPRLIPFANDFEGPKTIVRAENAACTTFVPSNAPQGILVWIPVNAVDVPNGPCGESIDRFDISAAPFIPVDPHRAAVRVRQVLAEINVSMLVDRTPGSQYAAGTGHAFNRLDASIRIDADAPTEGQEHGAILQTQHVIVHMAEQSLDRTRPCSNSLPHGHRVGA